MWIALGLFVLTYLMMIALPKYRAHVSIFMAIIFIMIGFLPLNKILGSINFNVLLMIAGTMGIVTLFIQSRMPSKLADMIIDKMPNVKWVVLALSIFAGMISAFIDNVATVLMVAPVAVSIAKKLNISPVKSVIAISIASNLEGAATLVGDTTSILLGGYANMNFLDFFWYQGRLGLFFVFQVGLAVATLVLYVVFRKDTYPVNLSERTNVDDYVPTYVLLLTILSLIGASFFPNAPELTNGIICMTYLFILMMIQGIRYGWKKVSAIVLEETDFFTLCLLTGIFMLVGGISHMGVVDYIANLFIQFGRNNVFIMYTILVFASVFFSAFIDNIPYVMTMLPVVNGIAGSMGIDPTILYFGLLAGATLGGNITPVGASANIAGLGILKKYGYEVSAKEFMSLSVPYTLSAVLTGYALIWLLFGV